jgi:hypothetical protein
VKHERSIFIPGWAQCGSNKKRARTRYTELVLLHPMGSTGHVVHSGMFGAWHVDAVFLCSGEPVLDPTKSVLGHVTTNVCFHIWWDVQVT